MATIRVSDDIYKKLCRVAGELTREVGRPVSLNEVLEKILGSKRFKPSDFQGAWKMIGREAEELLESVRKHWSRWKYMEAKPMEHPQTKLVGRMRQRRARTLSGWTIAPFNGTIA